jgi:phosphopantetheinyl transferase (holo-ACP synthase)
MKPLPFPYALNIGTDVVHLPRILRLISRPRAKKDNESSESYLERFTRRILCPSEQQDFHSRFSRLRLTTHGEKNDNSSSSSPSSRNPSPQQPIIITTEMARWLAGRFAAKEAARKAAPQGAASIGWKDVLVRTEDLSSSARSNGGSGRPEVVYLGENARVGKLSISHDGDYVVATVLAAG